MNNLLSDIPTSLPAEVFEELINTAGVRIERIISHGHTSPEQGWSGFRSQAPDSKSISKRCL